MAKQFSFICLPDSLVLYLAGKDKDLAKDFITEPVAIKPLGSFSLAQLWELVASQLFSSQLASSNAKTTNSTAQNKQKAYPGSQQSGLLVIQRIFALLEEVANLQLLLNYDYKPEPDNNYEDKFWINNPELSNCWKQLKARRFTLYILDSKASYKIGNNCSSQAKKTELIVSEQVNDFTTIESFKIHSYHSSTTNEGKNAEDSDEISLTIKTATFNLVRFKQLPEPEFGLISQILRGVGKLISTLSDIGKLAVNQLLAAKFSLHFSKEHTRIILDSLLKTEAGKFNVEDLELSTANLNQLADIFTSLTAEYLYHSAEILLSKLKQDHKSNALGRDHADLFTACFGLPIPPQITTNRSTVESPPKTVDSHTVNSNKDSNIAEPNPEDQDQRLYYSFTTNNINLNSLDPRRSGISNNSIASAVIGDKLTSLADYLYAEEEFSAQYWFTLGKQCRLLHKLGISLAQLTPQLVFTDCEQELVSWLRLNPDFGQQGIELKPLPKSLRQRIDSSLDLSYIQQSSEHERSRGNEARDHTLSKVGTKQDKINTQNELKNHPSPSDIENQATVTAEVNSDRDRKNEIAEIERVISDSLKLFKQYLNSDYVEPWQIAELDKFRLKINQFNTYIHGFFRVRAWNAFLDGYEQGLDNY